MEDVTSKPCLMISIPTGSGAISNVGLIPHSGVNAGQLKTKRSPCSPPPCLSCSQVSPEVHDQHYASGGAQEASFTTEAESPVTCRVRKLHEVSACLCPLRLSLALSLKSSQLGTCLAVDVWMRPRGGGSRPGGTAGTGAVVCPCGPFPSLTAGCQGESLPLSGLSF